MRKQGLWAHEIWPHFYTLKFDNFLHKYDIFIKLLLLMHQCIGNIMQLTDLQYLLLKRIYLMLCKHVCFVPISPIFSCWVTFVKSFVSNLSLYYYTKVVTVAIDVIRRSTVTTGFKSSPYWRLNYYYYYYYYFFFYATHPPH